MLSPIEINDMVNASVIAPAGYGKTQIIAEIASMGNRTLILTHTHAGVHAIKNRLKKLSVPTTRFNVDTIAGWSMHYTHAFPKSSGVTEGMPVTSEEWDNLYKGAARIISNNAVNEVIKSSYDRILIDEYQDCSLLQHELAISLSGVVPTIIFGDSMQGIFEFAGATLSWKDDIFRYFPLATELITPHRWLETNPKLGQWISETRKKLIAGEKIDLQDERIDFRLSNNAFDMGVLFDGLDTKEGDFAAIHCNKKICYRLAHASRGGFQAIEEMALIRLNKFAEDWDKANDKLGRKSVLAELFSDSFNRRLLDDGETETEADSILSANIKKLSESLDGDKYLDATLELMGMCLKHPKWKLYRSGLWRDVERSIRALVAGRFTSMVDATTAVRQQMTHAGRRLPKRTVSTPLLLKGLEFDNVIVPDASHFTSERSAQAKLFYVAISRATRSLTISSPSRYIHFDKPNL